MVLLVDKMCYTKQGSLDKSTFIFKKTVLDCSNLRLYNISTVKQDSTPQTLINVILGLRNIFNLRIRNIIIHSLNQVFPVHTKVNILCNNHLGFWKYKKRILLLLGIAWIRWFFCVCLILTADSICIQFFT